jgi:tRNA pseudouridine55 synthase
MSDCAGCPKAVGQVRPGGVAPARETPLSGFLSVDKPPGLTSHDVVAAVRRMAGQRKVGHAGTLDPMATGVLLVCLGAATRVAEFLMASPKRYRASIVLGTATDSYDADGRVVSEGGRTSFSVAEIEAALASFRGRLQQVPPMYSAVKREGQPLYRLARRGETVERASRTVDIHELILLDWTAPALVVEVACSPGTYIRSLAHDLGQLLGCGAYLAALVRLSSGRFTLEDAVSLERLAEAFRRGEEGQYLLPVDEALLDWPALVAGTEDARRILRGAPVAAPPPLSSLQPAWKGTGKAPMCRAYDLDGEFLGILTYDEATGRWRPEKVFAAGPAAS